MNASRNKENLRLLLALLGTMLLIVVAMMVSIFIVTRRPVVVVVPAGGPPTQPGETIAGPGEQIVPLAEAPPPEVSVLRLSAAPGIDDPLDPVWDRVAPVDIPLQAQQVAEPMLQTATITSVRVQAVRDADRYLFRLSWAQKEPAASSDFGQFSDAVAIQFPLVDSAPYTMGGPDLPVSILYWKAIWQKDVDEGFQDTVVTRPNAHNDFYWFASETGPYPADKLMQDAPAALPWMVAASAGNPMADFGKKCPMEEIRAHGFGTSTHVTNAAGQARGQWNQGHWYVVFERPVSDTDALIARFNENPQQQLIAFAVWDGTAQNRGGQKSISNWVPMRIQP